MTENNAAQPGLTDDEILDAIKAGVRAARDEGLACAGPDNYVQAGALALLSKLRAEGVQAGELPAYINDDSQPLQYRLGWNNCLSDCRAALASAPLADTLPLEKALYELVDKIAPGLDTGDLVQDARRSSTLLDAIMASAPVTGEAVSYQVRRTDGSPLACWETCTKDLYDETLATGRYNGLEGAPPCEVRALGVIDAAPQASKAVRLDAPAQVGGVRFGKGIHWSTVIAAAQRHHAFMNTPEKEAERIARAKEFVESIQADKDGGDCAKGAGDGDLMRFALEAIEAEMDPKWECNSYHPKLRMAAERLRAALSPTPSVVKQSLTATQTGEKGESDA